MRNDKWFNPKLFDVATPKIPRRRHKARHGDANKKPPVNRTTGRPLVRKPAKQNPKAVTKPGAATPQYRISLDGVVMDRRRPDRGCKREAKRQKILAGMVKGKQLR